VNRKGSKKLERRMRNNFNRVTVNSTRNTIECSTTSMRWLNQCQTWKRRNNRNKDNTQSRRERKSVNNKPMNNNYHHNSKINNSQSNNNLLINNRPPHTAVPSSEKDNSPNQPSSAKCVVL
jgi:hypothetical protein